MSIATIADIHHGAQSLTKRGDTAIELCARFVEFVEAEKPDSSSGAAVIRGLEETLTAEGFGVAFSCETRECGDISCEVDQFPLPRMIVDRFDFRYATMTGVYEDLQTWVTLPCCGQRTGCRSVSSRGSRFSHVSFQQKRFRPMC